MIKEALDFISGLKNPVRYVDKYHDTTTWPNGNHTTADIPQPWKNEFTVGTLESLKDALTLRGYAASSTVITVAQSGIRALMHAGDTPREDWATTLPFFKDDIPGGMDMDYGAFMCLLDFHTGNIRGLMGEKETTEDELREGLKRVSFEKREGVTYTDNGPVTDIFISKGDKVEGITIRLPKVLEITLRYGVRTFMIPLRFRFTINAANGAFKLTRMPHDGADDQYFAMAMEQLRGLPGKEWVILQGV